MKLLSLFLLIFVLLFSENTFSQKIITTLDGPEKIEPDTLSHWIKKNKIGFDISEIVFVNWNAGGTSSISGLLKGKFNRIYSKDNYNWTNELIVRYGLNKQDGIEVRKTEDVLQFNSLNGTTPQNSISILNSRMDMLTQIKKFPYLNVLHPLIFS